MAAAMVPTEVVPSLTPFTVQLMAELGCPIEAMPVFRLTVLAVRIGPLGFGAVSEIVTSLVIVSVAVAESDPDDAPILIVGLEGRTTGAVYRPAEEIVPVAELPPATPLTVQDEIFAPLAVNCVVFPRSTELAVPEMVSCWGGFEPDDPPDPPDPLEPPQPVRQHTEAAIESTAMSPCRPFIL